MNVLDSDDDEDIVDNPSVVDSKVGILYHIFIVVILNHVGTGVIQCDDVSTKGNLASMIWSFSRIVYLFRIRKL